MRKGLDARGLGDPGRGLELLQLHADARVAEESRDELNEFVEGPALELGPLQLHVEALRIAGRGEKLPGLLHVVFIVGAEVGVRIVRALGVAGEGPGKRTVQRRIAAVDHLGHDLAVDGHREGLTDAHVAVGRLVERHAHAVVAPSVRWHAVELHIGNGLHQRIEHVQGGDPHHVELPRPEQCRVRGRVLGEEQTHGIHVGQLPPVLVLQVVVGIAHEQRALPGGELLQHERTGPDGILGQTARRFDGLAGHDHRRQRIDHVEVELRVGHRELELDGVLVDDLNRFDERGAGGVLRLVLQQFVRVLHVLGGHLSPVDGRPVVELHAVPELEDPRRGIDHFPARGQGLPDHRSSLDLGEIPGRLPLREGVPDQRKLRTIARGGIEGPDGCGKVQHAAIAGR